MFVGVYVVVDNPIAPPEVIAPAEVIVPNPVVEILPDVVIFPVPEIVPVTVNVSPLGNEIPPSAVIAPVTANVPFIFVPYVPLPIFIVFVVGTVKFVPVPILIPPDAVESDPIIIGPVVRSAIADPPPIYSAPVVCVLANFIIPVVGAVALFIFEPSKPMLEQ